MSQPRFAATARTRATELKSPALRAAPVNMGRLERCASAVLGGGLVAFGLARRSLAGLAWSLVGGGLLVRGFTGHSRLYEALGVNTAVTHNVAIGVRAQHGSKIEKRIRVNRPTAELFRFWRNFEQLPDVMSHLLFVHKIDEKRSHWVARGPLYTALQWDAEIINERDGELIAWRSLPGGDVDTAGSVHFRPTSDGAGTLITVSLKFDPPGGKAVATIASLLGAGLEQELEADLERFKWTMERGSARRDREQP